MLSIVATPIGNLEDISTRALNALRAADVIAAEDTRRTRILLTHFQIPAPRFLVSYREHREGHAGEQIARFLAEGKRVAVCTDGGMPGISDPGYRLVKLAVERGLPFEVIPGASAVHVALVASGLSTSSYTFKGFAPRKPGPTARFFEMDKDLPHTLVLFESPYRVAATLKAALGTLGDRQAAVCIELTKKFERISRGFLSQLVQEYEGKVVKGEATLVIAGNNPKFSRDEDEEEDVPDKDSPERQP